MCIRDSDFRASEESLVQGLRKFKCAGNHQHANLGGGGTHRPHAIIEKSSDHAEWPPGVCRESAKSIGAMVSRHRRVRAYPAAASSSADGGTVAPSTPPGQCPGCKGNVEKHHPMHNRIPGVCKVLHVETIQYDCPA
eukprot:3757102-Karenia_brevis.AAC.1